MRANFPQKRIAKSKASRAGQYGAARFFRFNFYPMPVCTAVFGCYAPAAPQPARASHQYVAVCVRLFAQAYYEVDKRNDRRYARPAEKYERYAGTGFARIKLMRAERAQKQRQQAVRLPCTASGLNAATQKQKKKEPNYCLTPCGCLCRARTDDPLINSQVLYRLS